MYRFDTVPQAAEIHAIIPAADAAVQTTADVAAIYVKRYAAVAAATPADAAI